MFKPLLIIILSIPFSALLTGCDSSSAADNQPPARVQPAPVLTAVAETGYQVERSFVGHVSVKQDASIGFEAAGKIAKLFVEEGQHVAAGDLLAEQDTALLKVERLELDAELLQIGADLELVRSNLKRHRTLKHKGFSSEESINELQAQRKSLLASRKRLEAAIQANQLRIEKASLFAPFSGLISERQRSTGEVVAAGSPVFRLLQSGQAEVKAGVPVTMQAQLTEGEIYRASIGNRDYQLQLASKGTDVDPASRTVELRFKLLTDTPLVNGQLVSLPLPQQVDEAGYWLPLTALTDGIRGMWNVYALDPAEQDSYLLRRRSIQVLYATQTHAYVSGAIQPGEYILRSGLHRLVPGQRVKISERDFAGVKP